MYEINFHTKFLPPGLQVFCSPLLVITFFGHFESTKLNSIRKVSDGIVGTVFSDSTVLSDPEERFADERFAEERARLGFYLKIRTTPAWKNSERFHHAQTFAVKTIVTSSAALLTSKRLHFDGSKHFSRFPARRALRACATSTSSTVYTPQA